MPAPSIINKSKQSIFQYDFTILTFFGLKRPCSYNFEHMLYDFLGGCILGAEVNAQGISSYTNHWKGSCVPKWLIFGVRSEIGQKIEVRGQKFEKCNLMT